MSDWLPLPFDEAPAPPAQKPWTVSELTARLKAAVEGTFYALAVEGEISNCRQWSSGHLYFTLKDDAAQMRAVMFRTTVRQLRFRPEDGMRVVARGRISVYEIKGEYQLVCDTLEPVGLGALQAAFDQLKRRLQAEGLFDRTRKRPLPLIPRRIGVITSLDGAAVRDILRVLTTRHPSARILVRPARVQGEGAAQDLIRALRAVARVPQMDVVIIGRGGGSAEDLFAFNDEALARAIAACPVPVISAVGHEVDFTIADFVADVRAATPSNAAELVVERADHVSARIDRAHVALTRVIVAAATQRRQALERCDLHLKRWPVGVVLRDRDVAQARMRLQRAATARVNRAAQRFEALRRRLDRRDVRRVVAEIRTRLVRADSRLRSHIVSRRQDAGTRVTELSARLHALSPLAVLARGYAVCWDGTRTRILRTATNVQRGDEVRVTLAAGELDCRVEDVHE